MLKNSTKFENSSHFSYNDYKKKVNKKTNNDINIFVSVFFAGLLILLGLAKVFSPNVDIGISSGNEIVSMEDETTSAASIDERLRSLKLEDDGQTTDKEEMFSPELDEKVVLPHQNKPTVGQIEAENNLITQGAVPAQPQAKDSKNQSSHENTQPHTAVVEKHLGNAAEVSEAVKPVNAKVVVGSYATEKQAEVAKSIILDAGLGITPIVRNIGGYYTLQVGSYSTREKAQQVMNNLLKSNFPARVVVE